MMKAEIIENEKGFKVIKMTVAHVNKIFGSPGICDWCNKQIDELSMGYYIAVLNSFYCNEDYEQWLERTVNYPEDRAIEQKNFHKINQYLEFLNEQH